MPVTVKGFNPTTAEVSEIVREPSSTWAPFGSVTPRLFPSGRRVLAAVTETALGARESIAPTAGTVALTLFAWAVGAVTALNATNPRTAAIRTEEIRTEDNRARLRIDCLPIHFGPGGTPKHPQKPLGLVPILSPL